MDELSLMRIDAIHPAFRQYMPENLNLVPNCLRVGVVYKSMACGAAVAELTEDGAYLRYIYIDPKARLCGLGTYLLRGVMGECQSAGAEWVKAVYSPGMLEGGGQSLGILERAGFSKPQPMATEIAVRLGDISMPESPTPEGCVVYSGVDLPQELIDEYRRETVWGEIPPYADVSKTEAPIAPLCRFCAQDGELAGVMLVRRREEELFVSGIYVMERYRSDRIASAMIRAAIETARGIYPPETMVSTQNTTTLTIEMCYKLFGSRNIRLKETEFISEFIF